MDEQKTFAYQIDNMLLALDDFHENAYGYWSNEDQKQQYELLSTEIQTKLSNIQKIVSEIEEKIYVGLV